MKKKKIAVGAVIAVILAAVATVIIVNFVRKKDKKTEGVVYAEKVSDIIGLGATNENRYMGVVESQEVTGVDKSDDKKVKEIYVEEGDTVKKGDKLFSYDTDEMALTLKQMELEVTSISNNISNLNAEVKNLSAERYQASEDVKIEYTAQIQSLQAQINQYNYELSAKKLEIDRQKASIDNAIVYSPIDGVVKSINKDSSSNGGNGYYDGYGYFENYGSSGDNHFINIMAMGDYRIKATIDELTARTIFEGQPMLVRSRVDDTVWTGVVSKVDLEHPVDNSNDYMSGGSGTTKYPVYITLDSTDMLMLGQHVYVEPDYGQGTVKEGLWLGEYYLIQENDSYYVWAEDSDGYIEKRQIEVGEYDENTWTYNIVSGLTEDDYIAYPEGRIKDGMKVTHNYEDLPDDYYDEPDDGDFEISDAPYVDPEYDDDNMIPMTGGAAD